MHVVGLAEQRQGVPDLADTARVAELPGRVKEQVHHIVHRGFTRRNTVFGRTRRRSRHRIRPFRFLLSRVLGAELFMIGVFL